MATSPVTGFGAFDTPVDKNTTDYDSLNYKGSIGQLGVQAMDRCKNYVPTGNVAQDQECAGVNYMANNCLQTSSTQNQIISGVANVPTASSNCAGTYGGSAGNFELSVQDQAMITNVGKGTQNLATSTEVCSEVDKITRPATTEIFNCTKNTSYTEVACTQDLNPECSLQGGDLASTSVNPGSLSSASITKTDTPGVYAYLLTVNTCRQGEASGSISFEVQNIAWGASITMTISALDDAAAIGVNKTTVYAGYPNNGPQYSGSFFPTSTKDFQPGYTWTEEVGTTCIKTDLLGRCTATQPNYKQFYADVKLLDYCPAGYTPISQTRYIRCDEYGTCSQPPSDTQSSIPGFFCNAEGKFLMNGHEGNGTWAGTIPSSTWPLATGANTIELYWGTNPSSGGCGNITVQGVITNKVPVCSKLWADNCSIYEASSGMTLGNPE